MQRFIFYTLIIILLSSCFPYKNLIKNSSDTVRKQHAKQFRTLKLKNRHLSYIYSNPHQHKNIVFFVHGSPGSWESFAHFLDDSRLSEQYGIFIVDRPGYGQFKHEGSVPELGTQAEMLNLILNKHLDTRHTITLIGHSYGGPLIAKMAIEIKDTLNVKNLYFLAASMDPSLEKTKWFQYPAQWGMIKWMLPKNLVHCNEEILNLKQDLLNLKNDLNQLEKKTVLILHGDDDKLVPVENVSYMQKYLQVKDKNINTLKDTNHFIPWSHQDLIINTLLQLIPTN